LNHQRVHARLRRATANAEIFGLQVGFEILQRSLAAVAISALISARSRSGLRRFRLSERPAVAGLLLWNLCAPKRLSELPELGPQMSGTSDHRKAEEEYRQHAAELSRIAEHTEDPAERERLLRMADAWLQLAERMKNLSGRTDGD